ncbi:hypothetical protein KCP75_05080 [Salmonella enterica subsp. enterica]|nr:hypothetical protein KCP75_05080 [Salmonella enterica subsp. enterica]
MNDERTHRYEYDNTSKENPSLPLRPAWTAAGAGYPDNTVAWRGEYDEWGKPVG